MAPINRLGPKMTFEDIVFAGLVFPVVAPAAQVLIGFRRSPACLNLKFAAVGCVASAIIG